MELRRDSDKTPLRSVYPSHNHQKKLKKMKTGIHFERCNTKSAALHNGRDPEYLASVERSGKKHYDIFHDRTQFNSHWIHPDYAGKSLDTILDEMRQRYRDYVGQAPQEKDRVRNIKGREKIIPGWSPIREGVCPVREDTTPQDFLPFQHWLNERGVQIISIDIHLDEGHINPLSGEREYNRHAHIICDWTNHLTGKTAKLDDKAMSEAQVVLADALGMERGKSKAITGQYHLTALEYREKKAGETLTQLHSDIRQAEAELEEAEQAAKEAAARRDQAETAANREALKSNLYDIGSRVAGIFGRGAVAESRNEADEALSRAREAENRAAKAEVARDVAENAREMAENARLSAERAERKAQEEKAAYGREMYEQGQSAGYSQGRNSSAASLEQLQQLLAEKQQQLDELRSSRDARLDDARAEAKQQLEKAARMVSDADAMLKTAVQAFPRLEYLAENLAEMEAAGLSATQKLDLLRNGAIETDIKVRIAANKYHTVNNVIVKMARSTKRVMHVWFNNKRWADFLKLIKQTLQPQRRM